MFLNASGCTAHHGAEAPGGTGQAAIGASAHGARCQAAPPPGHFAGEAASHGRCPQAGGLDSDGRPTPVKFFGFDTTADCTSGRADFIPRAPVALSPFACVGDPYPGRSDSLRGLTLQDLELAPLGAPHALRKDVCSSELRDEGDDPFRGLSLDYVPASFGTGLNAAHVCDDSHGYRHPQAWDEQKPPSASKCPPPEQGAPLAVAAEAHMADTVASSRPKPTAADHGPAGHTPPPVPECEYFELASTTLRIATRSPRALFQELADIFTSWLEEAWVEERDDEEFAILAVVCLDGFKCSIKVRTYTETDCGEEGLPVYAVEFQRSEGNCLVFHKVYAAAGERVKRRLQETGDDDVAAPPKGPIHAGTVARSLPEGTGMRIVQPLPACNSLAGGRKEVHQAVFDMAHSHDSQQSQVEAVGELLSMVLDGQCDLQTLTLARVMEALKALAQSEDAVVNLLAARLVSYLAQRPEAKLFFASFDFLPILDRFQLNAKSPVARKIIGQVLETVRVADGRPLS